MKTLNTVISERVIIMSHLSASTYDLIKHGKSYPKGGKDPDKWGLQCQQKNSVTAKYIFQGVLQNVCIISRRRHERVSDQSGTHRVWSRVCTFTSYLYMYVCSPNLNKVNRGVKRNRTMELLLYWRDCHPDLSNMSKKHLPIDFYSILPEEKKYKYEHRMFRSEGKEVDYKQNSWTHWSLKLFFAIERRS